MKNVKIQFYVPKEDLELLDKKAEKLCVTRTDLLRCVLADYLYEKPHAMEITKKLEKAVSQSNPTNEIGVISDDKPVEGVFGNL